MARNGIRRQDPPTRGGSPHEAWPETDVRRQDPPPRGTVTQKRAPATAPRSKQRLSPDSVLQDAEAYSDPVGRSMTSAPPSSETASDRSASQSANPSSSSSPEE